MRQMLTPPHAEAEKALLIRGPEGRGGWVEGAGAARAAREGTRPWSTGAATWQREAARGEILKDDSGRDAGQGSSFTL